MINKTNTRKLKTIKKNIGQKLKLKRLKKGMTQAEIAISLELTSQQVQKYEYGIDRISAASLIYLCNNVLKCNISDFQDDEYGSEKINIRAEKLKIISENFNKTQFEILIDIARKLAVK